MNKRRLFLHIGTHKTGTTSIQRFLTLYRDNLLKYNYYYPQVFHEQINHNLFGSAFLENLAFKLEEPCQWYKDQVITMINTPPYYDNVIISSELLSAFDESALSELKSLVDNFSVRIVLYLRRQDLFIESMYNEHIKSPNSKSSLTFEMFLKKREHRLDYYSLCQRWAEHFGKENIIVRPFEREQFHEGDLIKDFLFSIGIIDYDSFDFNIPPRNSSHSLDVIDFLRYYNKSGLSNDKERMVISNFLYKIEMKTKKNEKERIMSPEAIQKFISKYDEDNKKIVREFIGNNRENLYLRPVSLDLPVHTQLLPQQLIDTIAQPLIKAFCFELIQKDDQFSNQKRCIHNLEQQHERSKKEKTLFIHIGRAKTGTSALQDFFSMNEQQLKAHDLKYIETARYWKTHHPLIWTIFKDVHENGNGRYWNHCSKYAEINNSPEEYYDLLKKEIMESPHGNFLISSEEFSVFQDSSLTISRLNDLLGDYCKIKIIIYLRKQDDFLESVYNQAVKGKEHMTAKSFKEFSENIIQCGAMDYEKLLEPWILHFGHSNIIVKCYQKEMLKPNIFIDFLTTLGIKDFKDFSFPSNEVNLALNFPQLCFIRHLNKKKHSPREHVELVKFIQSIPLRGYSHEKLMLTSMKRSYVNSLFTESNRKIARLFFNKKQLFADSKNQNKKTHYLYFIPALLKLYFYYCVQRIKGVFKK